MQDYPRVTSAQAVLSQEARVGGTVLADASQWAGRSGWQSPWTPSVPAAAGGPSSDGVAICARKELGLRRPFASLDSHQVAPARLVAAVVKAQGCGSILMMPVCPHVGAGLAQDNLTITAKAAAVAQLHGLPWTLAANFQVLPAQLGEAGTAAQAVLVIDDDGRWQQLPKDFDNPWRVHGLLFQDWSCAPHALKELARASWAVACIVVQGCVSQKVCGAVQGSLPKAATLAEWYSHAAISQMASAQVMAHLDCASAVREMDSSLRRCPRFDHAAAGFARDIGLAEGKNRIVACHKVKAHPKLCDIPPGDQLAVRRRWGSSVAVLVAKHALTCHAQPAGGLAGRVEQDLLRTRLVMKLAAATPPSRPSANREELRSTRPPVRAGRQRTRLIGRRRHARAECAGRVQYLECLIASRSPSSCWRPQHQPCHGPSLRLRGIVAECWPHRLSIGNRTVWPVVACEACGARTTKRCQCPSKQCGCVVTAAGTAVLMELARGLRLVGPMHVSERLHLSSGEPLAPDGEASPAEPPVSLPVLGPAASPARARSGIARLRLRPLARAATACSA